MEEEPNNTLASMLPEKGTDVQVIFHDGGDKEATFYAYNEIGIGLVEPHSSRSYLIPWASVKMVTWKEEGRS